MSPELENSLRNEADNQNETVNELKLVGYKELLQNSWRLAIEQFPIFLKTVLFVVAVFIFLSGSLFFVSHEMFISSQLSFWLTVVAIPLFGLLTAMVASFSLMRALVQREIDNLYRNHVKYVARHLVGISLVSLYLTIFTQAGYSLFFFPGIVVSVYLVFASLLVVSGQAKSFSALSTSVTMVYGRFLDVLGRFFFANLVIFAVVALVFVVAVFGAYGLLTFLGSNLVVGDIPLFFFGLVVFIIGSFYWLTCALVVLFESVKALPVAETLPITTSSLERVAKVLILVILLGIIICVLLWYGGHTEFLSH